MKELLAIDPECRSNSQLVVSLAKLGYVSGEILDMTYGLGNFWKDLDPPQLTTNDLYTKAHYNRDFTDLPFSNGSFNTVVFDPPYKLNGTGGTHPSDYQYGVADKVGWKDRHALIRAGIDEAARIAVAGGHVLLKCQDQVSGGKVRWQTIEFTNHAETQGLMLVDMAHLLGFRPQPKGRTQQHFRRNYSTLLIFRKRG